MLAEGVESEALVRLDPAAEREGGLQQVLLTDLDGSLLGEPGQVRVCVCASMP